MNSLIKPGNIDRFLHYNYSGNERWQSNRPLASVSFRNIKADGISMPLTAYGSPELPITLRLTDIEFSFREGTAAVPFIHAANYDSITVERVTIKGMTTAPLIKRWTSSGDIVIRDLKTDAPCPVVSVADANEPFVCKPI